MQNMTVIAVGCRISLDGSVEVLREACGPYARVWTYIFERPITFILFASLGEEIDTRLSDM